MPPRAARRRAVTFVEVLIAAGILAALLLPVLTLFSSTTEWAGQDIRRVEAMNLAVEVMEQLAHIHKRLGKLTPVPAGPDDDVAGELDLDAYAAKFAKEQGTQLLRDTSRCAWNTRVFLTPVSPIYRRFLRVKVVDSAPPARNFWPDALWEVRVRVSYPATAVGLDVRRDFLLTSYFFQKCRPDAKFRELE